MKRQAIEELLPATFRRAVVDGSVVAALLDAMEMLQAPSDAALSHLDAYFDARRAPDAFVSYLGAWVDLDRFYDQSFRDDGTGSMEPISPGLGRLRELIRFAAQLSKWRGTQQGLIAFLEVATGVIGFDVSDQVVDASGATRPFHIRVDVPEPASKHIALVERIIASEKPACVTHEFRFIG